MIKTVQSPGLLANVEQANGKQSTIFGEGIGMFSGPKKFQPAERSSMSELAPDSFVN